MVMDLEPSRPNQTPPHWKMLWNQKWKRLWRTRLLIKNMKNADFSPCGIPAKFIKLLYQRFGSKITTPIADLLNLIFRTGIYPKIWKVANITPVYKKKGARTDKSNWRPISILPTRTTLVCQYLTYSTQPMPHR